MNPLEVLSIDAQDQVVVIRAAAPTQTTSSITDQHLRVTLDGATTPFVVKPVEVESLSVTLLIDTSQSMTGDPIQSAKSAATDFINSLPDGSQVVVSSFDSAARIDQTATTDRTAAIEAIQQLQPQGETALYDGVLTAVASQPNSDRQLLVILSDGGDTASVASAEQARTAIEDSQIRTVSIALESAESDSAALGQLTSGPEHRDITVDNSDGLAKIYEDLAQSLAKEYEIEVPFNDAGPTQVALLFTDPDSGDQYGWSQTVTAGLSRIDETSEQPVPNLIQAEQTSLVSSPHLFWFGLVMICLCIVGLVGLVLRSGRSATHGLRPRTPQTGDHISVFNELRSNASLAIEDALVESDKAGLSTRLERSGLKIRTGEFLIIIVFSMIGGFSIGSLFFGLIPAFVMGLAGLGLPYLAVSYRSRKRSRAFASQLPDLLASLSNALKVGYSLPQAISSTAAESEEPARTELERALLEVRLGRTMVDSLRAASLRTGSTDLNWVVDAVEINSTVGGNLADVLDRVGTTIRSRVQLKAQVGALTAEARMSAYVLAALPPGLAAFIFLSNPEFFEGFFTSFIGYILSGLAVGLLVGGTVWIQRMIKSVAP